MTFSRLLALIGLAACGQAHAEYYLNVGRIYSEFTNEACNWGCYDSIFTEMGYGTQVSDRDSNSVIGVGKVTSWGAYELNFHDFGSTASYAGYPYDENGAGSEHCNPWPCTPTQWVYHVGEAKALSFTSIVEYKLGNFAPYVRLGGAAYMATFEYWGANESGDPMERDFSFHDGWKSSGVSLVYGYGLRYSKLSIDASYFPHIQARGGWDGVTTGNFRGINTVSVSYRAQF